MEIGSHSSALNPNILRRSFRLKIRFKRALAYPIKGHYSDISIMNVMVITRSRCNIKLYGTLWMQLKFNFGVLGNDIFIPSIKRLQQKVKCTRK